MKVYVVILVMTGDDGTILEDIFGVYSSEEKAEEAKEWCKIDDRHFCDRIHPLYWNANKYSHCYVLEKQLDENLHKKKEEQSLRDWQKEIMFSEGHTW